MKHHLLAIGFFLSLAFSITACTHSGPDSGSTPGPNKASPSPQLADTDCTTAGRTICTREYKPFLCRAGALEAKGSNRCEAMNVLRSMSCERKLNFVQSDAVCTAANVEAERSQ
ncbi:MAG: hypothetical protein EOP10_25380 [Proteobacteria bacterium]|nr:MAG: hypothetical protein EOP10_25380 [Pseudomonadota bacterium]